MGGMKRWAGLPGATQIPWTPLAKPLPKCTVSLVCSAAIALKTDRPFDPEIERRDPWFSDPSYRVVPRTARTGGIQVCHLHINPAFAEQDLNSVLPVERLDELAELGEIAQRRRPTTRTWATPSGRNSFSGRPCPG
jgi:D-proline reductase (dithiol) PrdB